VQKAAEAAILDVSVFSALIFKLHLKSGRRLCSGIADAGSGNKQARSTNP
jgi:hypothetical protein